MRRDDELIFMSAEDDETPFQLLAAAESTKGDIPMAALRVHLHSGAVGSKATMHVEMFDIRAESISEKRVQFPRPRRLGNR